MPGTGDVKYATSGDLRIAYQEFGVGSRDLHTGDGLLATIDGPSRAVECAMAIRDAVHELGIHVRAGVHTGEFERRGDDVGGIGVNIGSRVAALAGPDEVWVSRDGQGPHRRIRFAVQGAWPSHTEGRARRVGALRAGGMTRGR